MHCFRAQHILSVPSRGFCRRRTTQLPSTIRALPIQPLFIKSKSTLQQNLTNDGKNTVLEPKRQRGKSSRKASLRRPDDAVSALSNQGSRTAPKSKVVTALCATEEYDIPKVVEILSAKGYSLDPHSTGLYPEVVHFQMSSTGEAAAASTDGPMGDIFIFSSGTIVGWDISENAMQKLATQTLLSSSLNPHLNRIETEDLEFFDDASSSKSSVSGDRILLGTQPRASSPLSYSTTSYTDGAKLTLTKIAFSSGLARSAKLAVLESSLESYFVSTRDIPTLLSRGSRLPIGRSMILRKTGELFSVRAQLNLYSELTDSLPDLFWDSRSELGLEENFEQIGRALDVGVRIRALNSKLDYAGEINTVLREKVSEQRGLMVEWLIAALITFDIILQLDSRWRENSSTDKEA